MVKIVVRVRESIRDWVWNWSRDIVKVRVIIRVRV